MRKAFYLLAIISAGLFIYSAVQLGSRSNTQQPALGDVKGFEDVNKNDEYKQLTEKFKQKIREHKNEADKNQTIYFWMSLLVTALTAGSTLVSAIQAAKKEPANDPKQIQKFAIIIAILAFCSTVSNFASSHFNDVKTEETKQAVEISTMRIQFYADYEKASAENKSFVIKSYDDRLD